MTTDLLFDAPEQPSPRLAWMRKHGVIVMHVPGDDAEHEVRDAKTKRFIGLGWTEDEALADAAHRMGWKLWNEEEAL